MDFEAGSDGSAEVQGLVVQQFSGSGIFVQSNSNLIDGNFIGTNSAGTGFMFNIGNGIDIEGGATGNTVGGTTAGAANLISANILSGVLISGVGTSDNVVLGNLIGTNEDGTAGLGNSNGVKIADGATGNTVGGAAPLATNVISGNFSYGVEITDSGTMDNVVLGNLIGTDSTGTAGLANFSGGVAIKFGASGNSIGDVGVGNVISGNFGPGVYIFGNSPGTDSSGNVVLGNLIGTDSTGESPIQNKQGVLIVGNATDNTIGGTATGASNVISGNATGLYINGASSNIVLGNLIGTDITGMVSLGNAVYGVNIGNGATDNTVGGTATGARNVISGNNDGVYIGGAATSGNVVLGNLIGTDIYGASVLGNTNDGVVITNGATGNTVGGAIGGATNVISGNTNDGVYIAGGASGNVVLGNLIGADITGSLGVGNGGAGLVIQGGASGNTVGGADAGYANVISFNGLDGVYISGSGTSDNVVLGNLIGADSTGASILGNSFDGVDIRGGATDNTVGGTATGAANVISGNSEYGVYIAGTGTSGNMVLGNLIGTDITGAYPLGNLGDGVRIVNGTSGNTIGGTTTEAANVISGNGNNGVTLAGTGTSGNVVLGNFIGTDITGSLGIGNVGAGLVIKGGASGNTVGGADAGYANVISFNGLDGVYISGSGTSDNVVLGNLIGTDSTGASILGNGFDGVDIRGEATGNTVGGTATGAANVISGNSEYGVYIAGTGTSGNMVLGNLIGTDITGAYPLGNLGDGVRIVDGASGNTIGGTTTEAANVISGNGNNGVTLVGTGTSNNVVLGNFIGTNITGSFGIGNVGAGLVIQGGAAGNTVGGTDPGSANVISFNGLDGVYISGSGTSDNVVLGNLIGTDSTGASILGNGFDGVDIRGEATGNTVGGTATGAANVISGNSEYGVYIAGTGTSGNIVLGNLIGTDITGAYPLGNLGDGVRIVDGASGNTIGGTTTEAANVISGNSNNGVTLVGTGTSGNVVLGNFIGTDITGELGIGNFSNGVSIGSGATGNSVGGSDPGSTNVISGNSGDGVYISGPTAGSNVVLGNLIGTDISGTSYLGNSANGVELGGGTTGNTVGGTALGAANVISGNDNDGVYIYGSDTSSNVVLGNLIGTDSSGTSYLGNSRNGVELGGGAARNTVGGTASGAANIISGNYDNGVYIYGSDTSGNVVLGNLIGTDISGANFLANAFSGVVITGGATDNTIGGTTTGSSNVISGNGDDGVHLDGSGTNDNLVLGNLIGTDITGAYALGNGHDGVFIGDGASANTIGGTAAGARNVISGNNHNGVIITDPETSNNLVLGNFIGTDSSGYLSVTNRFNGLTIENGATGNTIGGTAAGARNVISGNYYSFGVNITDSGTSDNVVLGNLIGTDVTGTTRVANAIGVFISNGATDNTIGGETVGATNIISGNDYYGVYITGVGTSDNVVLGNLIGTDITGYLELGNGLDGVIIRKKASGNTIGGTATGARNVISGNYYHGVYITDRDTNDNVVLGNLIGTDITGAAALPNGGDGVIIANKASDNTIGGAVPGAANVISGNSLAGVDITDHGTTGNVVLGDLIGTDITGALGLGNGIDGVDIVGGAAANTVGGTVSGAANVISDNGFSGVLLAGANNNVIYGNLIGTDVTGTVELGNDFDGVDIEFGAAGNTIGGATAAAANVISGNEIAGVYLGYIRGASDNVILGNLIGTDITGTLGLGNGLDGIELGVSATGNTLGGTVSGSANIISGNARYGIYMYGASDNAVLGNLIGTDISGAVAIGNGVDGVKIGGDASGNTVGGSAAGANVISGNTGAGIDFDVPVSSNTVSFNTIGASRDQLSALPNGVGLKFSESGDTIGAGSAADPSVNFIAGNATELELAGNANVLEGLSIGLDPDGDVLALPNGTGVLVTGADNTIGGMAAGAGNVISGNAGKGVDVYGADASDNVVLGNLIGTDPTGLAALGNGASGVQIGFGATGNTVGGTDTGAGNIISGNAGSGVYLYGSETNSNVVLGNLIGTDESGALGLGNSGSGVYIAGATANTIGGTAGGAGNVISGNAGNGVYIYGTDASDNVVLGNLIGTDLTGLVALGNGSSGVEIKGGASGNTVGGTDTGAGNIISGNAGSGVYVYGSGTDDNVVLGNLIGTDKSGTASLANVNGVVIASGPTGNTIGGEASGSLNLISGNSSNGVEIDSASGNVVLGNYIGTDLSGTSGVANGLTGVALSAGATENTIGGVVSGDRNIISGNGQYGVVIRTDGTSDNVVLGNFIGTDVTGTLGIANGIGVGIEFGATANTIGGTATGSANLISGNGASGIYLRDADTSENVVLGNLIGTDASGTLGLGNSGQGVFIGGATANTIGGTDGGADNVISGNAGNGVYIYGADAADNVILGNLIGTDASGAAALGNGGNGVDIRDGATGNTVGGTATGAGNVISGNAGTGIYLYGDGTDDNVVLGNLIGTDKSGTASLPNNNGVQLAFGPTGNTIGGDVSGAMNLISGNSNNGLEIDRGSGNLVLGNYIGTDVSGTVSVANGFDGVALGQGATGNTIGGTSTGAANLISGNSYDGVDLYGSGTNGNVVLGNLIGTDITGTENLGNGDDGVVIDGGAANNTVGGTALGAANVISGNSMDGVLLNDDDTTGNLVLGNLIGTNAGGTASLENGENGVLIKHHATDNTVGGTVAGAANVISGNSLYGVYVTGAGTNDNVILGNLIGTDSTGVVSLGNSRGGVEIARDAAGNTVGGTVAGAANVISGNGGNGIQIRAIAGSGTQNLGNIIQGNFIGTDTSGTVDLGNAGAGILLNQGASANIIGGTATGAGNTIAFNAEGVVLQDAVTLNDSIEGNSIFGNTGLGISLTGGLPNHGQPAPVLTNAVSTSTTTVTGNLTAPNGVYRLEFFASPSSGPGFQGKTFLGSFLVTVSGGTTPFTATGLLAVPANSYMTATATSLAGDTSQFGTMVASQLVITQQPSPTATAGVAFATQPIVKEEDALGNVITTDSTSTVTVARGDHGTGALQGSELTVTLVNGVATFSGLFYDVAETLNLSFTTNAGSFTATSDDIVVSPAAAFQLVVTQQPSPTATAGVAFATQPVVKEEDAFGNVINTDSTHTVTVARGNHGTASLQGSNLTVTLVNGVATFSGLSYNVAEPINLSFSTNAGSFTATSDDIVVSPAAAFQLVVTQQPSPTATAGVVFATQPVVKEEDAFNNVITTDSTHTVTVARGNHGTASLQGSNLTVTLANGVATFSGLSYNVAETINLSFTTNAGSFTATSDDIMVSPAAAFQLVVTQQPSPTATAGVPFATQPVVKEEDAFGNVITTDSTHTVTVARGNHGTASLQGSNLTVTLVNGVATFSGLSYNVAEPINLSFTTNAGSFTATSDDIVVSPAAAFQLVVTQQPSPTATAGVVFATQPVVKEEDAFNNVITTDSTHTVTVARGNHGTASLQGSNLTVTLVNGVATFSGLSYNVAEPINLSFSTNAGSFTATSNDILVSPATAFQLVVTQQPATTATAGVAFSRQPVVKEEDAFNNVITTDSTHTVTVARGNHGTAALQGSPLTVTLANGVATFSGLSYNVAETLNLSFSTDAGSFTATSNDIMVSPAAAFQLVVTQQPSPTATAGVPFSTQPVVKEEDAFGNGINTDSTHTVTVARGNHGTASLQGSNLTVTLVNGVATFSGLSYNVAETINLSFTTNAGSFTATSDDIVVSPAAAFQLVVTQQPSPTATAGVAFATQPVVKEEDAFNNVITTDSTHTVTVARGNHGTASLQGSNLTVTLANGVATFSGLSYNVAEPINLSFTTNAGAFTATSDDILVSPAAPFQLVVTQQPSPTATAGVPFATQPVVKEEDAFGNVITTDSTHTVTVARGNHGTASLQGSNLTVTLVNGVATFSGLSYDLAQTMNLSFFTNAGAFTATSNDILVNPAATFQLVVTQQPSATATAGVDFTTQPVVKEEDAFGNVITTDSTHTVTVARGNHGTASLQGSNLTVTLVNGVATFSGLSYNVAEPINLSFSTNAGSFTATSNDIVVSPAAAFQLVVTQQPSTTATAGVAFATQPVVKEEDAFNNVITTDSTHTVTVARGNHGTASLQGSNLTVTLVNGVATFSGLSYNVAEPINLSFSTNAGSFTATSNDIVVSPAAASKLVVTQQPSTTATAGVTFGTQPIVTEEDAFNNVIATDSTSTVTALRGNHGTGTLQGSPKTVQLANGVATFSGLFYDVAETLNLSFFTNKVGVSSATSNDIVVSPAAAFQLVVTQQPSATATAGVAFATQPVVKEEDAFNNVITTDSTHTVTVARGNHGTASLQGSNLTVTLVNGVATFSGLSYNVAEPINLSFSTNAGSFTATSNDIVVSPAAASKLVVTQQPSTTATAGVTFGTQPIVTEEDAFNNVIATDSTSTVTALRGNHGTGTLQGSPKTVQLANGVATFSGLFYDVAETLNLSFFTNKVGVSSATSNDIVVSPAAAFQLVVTQQPSTTATAGVAFGTQPIVTEEDAFNNVIATDSTHTVTVARGNHGTGTLQGSALTVTLVNGVATFTGLSYNIAETLNLSFTTNAGSFTATSNDIVVSPAAASKLVVTQQPSTTATAGVTFGTQPIVTEEDAFNNVIATDSTSTVTALRGNHGTGTLQGSPKTVQLANGVATFSGLFYDVAETLNLSFFTNKVGVSSATSNDIVVSPAAAFQLVVTQQPSTTATAGVAFATQPIVTEEDAFNNVIATDSTHTVTVARGNHGTGTLQGSALTVTLVNGVATFTGLSYNIAETLNLSFTTNAGSFTATSNDIVVSPATAAQLVFAQQPSDTGTGQAINPPVAVQIEDQFGNVETGDNTSSLSIAIASGPTGASFAGGSTTSAIVQAGVATFATLILNTGGAYTLKASDAAPALTSAPSNSFAVGQAPAIISDPGTTFTAGTFGSFTVKTTGDPAATLSENGTLPHDVTFVDNGDGTATLSGTPDFGTGGVYAITITASNFISSFDQPFTLTVAAAAPVVTLPTSAPPPPGNFTATLGGTVVSSDGPLLERGIVYAKTTDNPDPMIGGHDVTVVDDASLTLGAFTENINGLAPGTGYSFVAFARNAGGIDYTSVATFTTTQTPATAISGLTNAPPGQAITFTLLASDPLAGMQTSKFVFHINWGDGTPTTVVTALSGTTTNHTYANPGTYVIQISATDAHGNILPTGKLTVTIARAFIVGSTLDVFGTAGNDTFVLTAPSAGSIEVSENGVDLGTFAPAGGVVIENSGGTDTLQGPNAVSASTWTLSGAKSGTLMNTVLPATVSFSGITNLTGGTGPDNFVIQTGASGFGTANGGAGLNTLDYSNLTGGTGVTVNLLTRAANDFTSVTGFTMIVGSKYADMLTADNANADTLIGGAGNDTLVGGGGVDVLLGGADNDTLRAGSGPSLLVGGSGEDSLTGGTGDDILIGALLSYYNEGSGLVDTASLSAIMAEWKSSASFATRTDALFNNGLAGSGVLNGTTITADGGTGDTLNTGSGGQDWFFVFASDSVFGTPGKTTDLP